MGLFSKKATQEKVELQNIVLGINEKKLEVSPKFLDDMTKIYISKRMSIINEHVSSFETIKTVQLLYSKYDAVLKILEELIAIEPYYNFNPPVPSEYKQELIDKKPMYVTKLLTRKWRQAGFNGKDPLANAEISKYFRDCKEVYDTLPDESKKIVDDLHRQIYGYGLMEEPPAVSEPEEDGENAEAADGAAENTADTAEKA